MSEIRNVFANFQQHPADYVPKVNPSDKQSKDHGTYNTQRKYLIFQKDRFKNSSLIYSTISFGGFFGIHHLLEHRFKLPMPMSWGLSGISTLLFFLSTGWPKIEEWSQYKARIDKLDDWYETRQTRKLGGQAQTFRED